MDLKTESLGLKLPHPIVVGASPMADDLDMARRLEDAGAAALVMRSLFAEQIVRENLNAYLHEDDVLAGRSASAAFVLPPRAFVLSPDQYLEQLAALKDDAQGRGGGDTVRVGAGDLDGARIDPGAGRQRLYQRLPDRAAAARRQAL
jgi:hypothetical protein